jgi:hydrogenase/urease accessory protein HupE
MRNFFRSTFNATLAVAVLPALAYAHPGHDDHELTWEFSHLAAHPLATLGCVAFLAVGGWVVWRLVSGTSKRAAARPVSDSA